VAPPRFSPRIFSRKS